MELEAKPGQRSLGAAEAEIDRFIAKRAEKEERDVDEADELWRRSVERRDEQRRKENQARWYAYHADQAERLRRTMEPLIAFHEARAADLCEENGQAKLKGDRA